MAKPVLPPLAGLHLKGAVAVVRVPFATVAKAAWLSIWDLGLNQNLSKWVRRTRMRGLWPSEAFQHGEGVLRTGAPLNF